MFDMQIDCNGASVREDVLLAFKAIVARGKFSETVHFEIIRKTVFGLGRKLGQAKSSEQMGASNKEQTCSHVNKGFNANTSKKGLVFFFLMCHFQQVLFPNDSG